MSSRKTQRGILFDLKKRAHYNDKSVTSPALN